MLLNLHVDICADDIVLWSTGPTAQAEFVRDALQIGVACTSTYLTPIGLAISLSKTAPLIYNLHQRLQTTRINISPMSLSPNTGSISKYRTENAVGYIPAREAIVPSKQASQLRSAPDTSHPIIQLLRLFQARNRVLIVLHRFHKDKIIVRSSMTRSLFRNFPFT